jgi:hypothetical protein
MDSFIGWMTCSWDRCKHYRASRGIPLFRELETRL